MNGLIGFLVLMVFLISGMTQHGDLTPKVGYGIAVPLGVLTMVLAIIRYKRRKDAGE
jgi:hypothetical protein